MQCLQDAEPDVVVHILDARALTEPYLLLLFYMIILPEVGAVGRMGGRQQAGGGQAAGGRLQAAWSFDSPTCWDLCIMGYWRLDIVKSKVSTAWSLCIVIF